MTELPGVSRVSETAARPFIYSHELSLTHSHTRPLVHSRLLALLLHSSTEDRQLHMKKRNVNRVTWLTCKLKEPSGRLLPRLASVLISAPTK